MIRPILFTQFEHLAIGQSTKSGGLTSEYGGNNLGESVGDDLSIVEQNKELFCNALGFERKQLAKSKQVHGDQILVCTKAGKYEGYDAIITATKGILLAVTAADCVPIALYDAKNEAIAAIHAGWKGSANQLVTKTVVAMQENFGTNPADLYAYIGTCISGANYEVGWDVVQHFNTSCIKEGIVEGKYLLDLKKCNADQLLSLGTPSTQIEITPYCTVTHNDDFHSHRAEGGKAGRMLLGIGIY